MQVHHVDDLSAALLRVPAVASDERARELAVLMTLPTGRTSSGHAYLQEPAWVRFRDWVPHILADGPRTLAAVDVVIEAARDAGSAGALDDAAGVVRQVVMTAAVTAPSDLWLLRSVLGAFARLGLSERLLAGEALRPARLAPVRADELRVDLRFLLSRGLLLCAADDGFRIADHAAAHAAFAASLTSFAAPHDARLPSSSHAASWARVFSNTATDDERTALHALLAQPLPPHTRARGRFAPSPADIELGFRLVPIVVGLRAAARHAPALADADALFATNGASVCADPALAQSLVDTLRACGLADGARASSVGKRVFERGIGPFGIIEAYHGYMRSLDDVLTKGRGAVWVERSANVAASQDANRATFERANDALDRFCADTGFRYRVFIEHAMGRGEATRQRVLRDSARTVSTYVGADLEDAAIDAAIAERDAGHLPAAMVFVRNADIGKPDILVDAMRAQGIDPNGAVMIVGNGFHEVREQTDARMTAVLEGYARAGIVLLFTEETGLGVDDLLETAWNTYHAGFKYVHERSGQGLRPAEKRAPSRLEDNPPASWAECAERAGYVRLDGYSPRGRTVYPYTPTSGSNPAISVTHFCVPAALALSLRVVEEK
jgi:hypothetical protein